MTERFTEKARKVLELALREALSMGHNYIGTEHILLALSRQEDTLAATVLTNFGATRENLEQAIRDLLQARVPNEAAIRQIVRDEITKAQT